MKMMVEERGNKVEGQVLWHMTSAKEIEMR